MRSSRKATADTPAGATQAAIRTWVAQETASGRRATRPLVVLGMGQIALAVAQVWCVALVLGRAIASAAAGGGYGAAAWMPLFGFTAASVLRAAVQFAATTRAAATGADQRRRLRSTALGQMLDAGPTLLRGRATGALVATLVDQVEQLDGFFARWLPAASLAMFGPLLVLAVLAPIDRQACLVLLATGCAVPVLQAVFGIGAARASRRQFTALARLQVRFLDRVRGVGTLVLAGAIEHEAEAMQDAADELRRRTMRILRVAFASSAALDCAFVVALVLVAIADRHALLDRNSAPAVARALFALLLVAEFFAPLRAFALAYQDKHRIVAAAEDFSRLPPARAPAAPPGPVRTVDASGVTVAFERVSFAWDAQRGSVLSDLSFRVTPGETALLVGPSGAGKSTVLELLLGFATPSSGKITVNGAELASIVPQALSAMTAWIGQKPMLFAGTIGENIRFARPDASAAELDDAIRAARLDSLLRDLPDGVRTRIGEGGYGLSGGQAQRIAVARAFLKDAPLLLLDEPTAHLDPATEREVFESLRRLALGRTVLLASHSAAATAFGGRRIELGQTPPLRSALSEVGA